jgi:hypothetical protein
MFDAMYFFLVVLFHFFEKNLGKIWMFSSNVNSTSFVEFSQNVDVKKMEKKEENFGLMN